MSDNPPDWAIERAQVLINAACIPGEHYSFGAERALAQYVAAHEEPPVDPLLECLRETFGGCAPEFFSAFKAALDWRGLEVVEKKP